MRSGIVGPHWSEVAVGGLVPGAAAGVAVGGAVEIAATTGEVWGAPRAGAARTKGRREIRENMSAVFI